MYIIEQLNPLHAKLSYLHFYALEHLKMCLATHNFKWAKITDIDLST